MDIDFRDTRKTSNQAVAPRPKNNIKKLLFFVVVIFFIGCLGYWFYGQSIWLSLQMRGYQSVFLTNGQVYFGKLSVRGQWLKLSDIYYLQAADSLQQAGGAQVTDPNKNIQLVKLGSELHGPDDAMYIERDKVLFWENMKADSKVQEAINKSKGGVLK